MSASGALRRFVQATVVAGLFVTFGQMATGDVNPAVLSYKLPNQIQWVEGKNGAATANLVGDPEKPGFYIYLNKWHPHHMSHPHFHQYDRYVTVLSGTWWIGTGAKYDPDTTVPMPAGAFVIHFAKQIHWDGAKDEECVLEISGQGPATSTPAEAK